MKINNVVVTESLPVVHIHTHKDFTAWLRDFCTSYNVAVSVVGKSLGTYADIKVCGKETNVLRAVAFMWGMDGSGQDFIKARMYCGDPLATWLWEHGVTDDMMPDVHLPTWDRDFARRLKRAYIEDNCDCGTPAGYHTQGCAGL